MSQAAFLGNERPAVFDYAARAGRPVQ